MATETDIKKIRIVKGTQAQIEAYEDLQPTDLLFPTDAPNFLTTDNVINNTSSTSTTDVLSANMGKELATQISNLQNIGRFCAIWEADTGVPTSEPPTMPYVYKTGDYFRIGVAGYRVPTGTEYVQGAYDTVAEETGIGDVWYFDGTQWKKQASSGGGTVQDVQVNGTSVLSGGIANIPLATNQRLGVVKQGNANETGISVNVDGVLTIFPASSTRLEVKTGNAPVVSSNLNKAVMEGLGNNSLTWTDTYKSQARATIGAGTSNVKIEVIDW